LTLEQAERLLDIPDANTNKVNRDRTLLALLVACGLRRQELIKATTFGGALSWKFGLAVRHPKQ
jgi:site-specific recombinase XerD